MVPRGRTVSHHRNPGRRHWYANVLADPNIVVHAGGLDIPARARPVHDLDFRRRVFTDAETRWYREQADLEDLIRTAPMIEVELRTPEDAS